MRALVELSAYGIGTRYIEAWGDLEGVTRQSGRAAAINRPGKPRRTAIHNCVPSPAGSVSPVAPQLD